MGPEPTSTGARASGPEEPQSGLRATNQFTTILHIAKRTKGGVSVYSPRRPYSIGDWSFVLAWLHVAVGFAEVVRARRRFGNF